MNILYETIASSTPSLPHYVLTIVDYQVVACTCPSFQNRHLCKHMIARQRLELDALHDALKTETAP